MVCNLTVLCFDFRRGCGRHGARGLGTRFCYTFSLTLLLGQEFVAVSFTASVYKSLTASRLSVVKPAGHVGNTRSGCFRLAATICKYWGSTMSLVIRLIDIHKIYMTKPFEKIPTNYFLN